MKFVCRAGTAGVLAARDPHLAMEFHMKRYLIIGGIFALAAPAMAQNMQSEPSPPPSSPPATQSESPAPSTGSHSSPFGPSDADHNGSLNQAEFNAMVRARAGSSAPSDADLTAAFQRADADRNGEVTAAEAQAMQRTPQ